MGLFKRASKAAALARVGIVGVSGGGKTFTALGTAEGLGGPVAVIDTERGSASKYADRFAFDVCELADRSVEGYAAAIREAAEAGYRSLVIDSLSHAWHSLLEDVEKLAKSKYRGNTWSAWSEATPRQRRLVDAILEYPGHVIATMRAKTEWGVAENDRGKSSPVRVGLAPEQRAGLEYEFDVLLEISAEHVARVIKDRSGRFQDRLLEKPGREFGRELAAWLSDGAPVVAPVPTAEPATDPRVLELRAMPEAVRAAAAAAMRAARAAGEDESEALDAALAAARGMAEAGTTPGE